MNRRHWMLHLPACAAALPLLSQTPPPAKRWRVAVIGHSGRGNYGHGLDSMWLELPQFEVVAVADADAKGLAAAQTKLKLQRGFASYETMLREVQPDLVAIGPRHVDQHHDMVLAAAAAGARGIYMEKPFCRTPAEADAIVAACAKSGTNLALAHRNRHHPVMGWLREFLKQGGIGQILELRGRGKEDARGGVLDLWVLGSHVINMATYFGGAPRSCSAQIKVGGKAASAADVRPGDEGLGLMAGDEVHARYELQSGLPFYFDSIRNAGLREAGFGLQIIGNKGVVDLRADREPLAHLLEGSPHQPGLARVWKPITSAGVDKPEPIAQLGPRLSHHHIAALDLLAAIEENRPPLCDDLQGRETVEMICATALSHGQGGKQVSWPLSQRGNPWSLWA